MNIAGIMQSNVGKMIFTGILAAFSSVKLAALGPHLRRLDAEGVSDGDAVLLRLQQREHELTDLGHVAAIG